VLVRKRYEAAILNQRGVKAFTLQRHRFDALGRPEVLQEDLDLLLEVRHPNEPLFDVLVVDEFHNWSTEFIDVACSLWTGEDCLCTYDEHQAMMFWAGAVKDVKSELHGIMGVTLFPTLTENRRSTPEIVKVLNTVVPREMHSSDDPLTDAFKYRPGKFHIERCTNFEDEMRFVYNVLMDGYEDVQILARTSSICRRASAFLEGYNVPHTLYLKGDRPPGKKTDIIIQTVHTAQGTGHVSVFLLSCNQGVLPYSYTIGEHNVFYVACSRAIRDLFISYYGNRSEFLNGLWRCA